MSDWIDELFDGQPEKIQIDWKTQSLLVRMFESSVLTDESHTKNAIIQGSFTRDELDSLFVRLASHQKELSENPSQTEISKFIKKLLS